MIGVCQSTRPPPIIHSRSS
uniref:Uncharacterized protein n=1 Tax=Arundo donax TaxID=35708 RepID=A0A0A9FGN5_ARUDO